MKILGWTWFFVLLGSLIPMSSRSLAMPPSKRSQVTTSEVLWWLPEDTETVAVARNPPSPAQKQDVKIEILAGVATVSLGGVRRGKFGEQLLKLPILQIVAGSRKFRAPRGLGLTTYEGCSAVHLQSDLPKDHALPKWLEKNANRTEMVAGYKAYIFDEKLELDQWHFLIVQPSPNLLLYATNKNFLKSVLLRRQRSAAERKKTIRALPPTLKEWKYVDTDADEWALRHYRQDQALLDPTSPLSGAQRMANVPDKSAVGVTYSLNQKRNAAVVYYLAAPRDATDMTKVYKNFWTTLISGTGGISDQSQRWRPQIKEQSGNVVEMRFNFSSSNYRETFGMFTFGLLALMGHAIFV